MMLGKWSGGRRWLLPVLGALVAAGMLATSGSCNEHRLVPFEGLVEIGVIEDVAIPEKPKLDLLWVVDNSASMCQEQATLASTFDAMAEKLLQLKADINVAVVTTDVEGPTYRGRFQNTPATENHLSCDRSCLQDDHCGGGCLCGVPHIRRCESKADCKGDQECVAAPDSSIRHCAEPCVSAGLAHEHTSDKCGADVREQQVFTCQMVPTSGGNFCTLTPCDKDADCNNAGGQGCMPGPDGLSYCRRLRRSNTECQRDSDCPLGVECEKQPDDSFRCLPTGQCPPPTCVCPETLPTVLNSSDPTFVHNFGCLAAVGTKGDTFEKGLEAMRKALEPRMTASGGPNEGFLRKDAFLGVIILSDENDCSDAGYSCDPAAERCIVALADGRTRGETEDDGMRCAEDSLDLDAGGAPVHYCRLPRRDASECEHFRDWLRPVDWYADFLRRQKDDPTAAEKAGNLPCDVDSDCVAGEFCSRKAKRCIDDKVVVGAIVGPRDPECVFSCPSENPVLDCVKDPTCQEPCHVERGEGAFCADRVYEFNHPVLPTCTSVNGQAFNGRRYRELVNAFGAQGVQRSICANQEEFRKALKDIGDVVVAEIRIDFCLSRPLMPCRSHAQCGEGLTCHGLDAVPTEGEGEAPAPAPAPEEGDEEGPVRATTFCADEDGLPAGVQMLIFQAPEEGEEDAPLKLRTGVDAVYHFIPNKGPKGRPAFGCFQFISGGPRPGEQVRLAYRAGLLVE